MYIFMMLLKMLKTFLPFDLAQLSYLLNRLTLETK